MPTQIVCIKDRWSYFAPLIEEKKIVYCGRTCFMDQGPNKWTQTFCSGPDKKYNVFKYYLYVMGLLNSDFHFFHTPETIRKSIGEIHGKILGCWCENLEECHCTVLVYLATGVASEPLITALNHGLTFINDKMMMKCRQDVLLDSLLRKIAAKKYETFKDTPDLAYHAAFTGEIYLIEHLRNLNISFDPSIASKYALKNNMKVTASILV